MPPSKHNPEHEFSFGNYLRFVSDMLGGDIFPIKPAPEELRSLICERAIDYNLAHKITLEIIKHNAVFKRQDTLEAYSTLDALGALRAQLLDNKGDVNQISLIDRMGELTVSFFNLQTVHIGDAGVTTTPRARVYPIRKNR